MYMEKDFRQICGIQSLHFDQWMYTSPGFKYNTDRTYVLFWGDTSTQPESSDDMLFEIVGYGDYAGIKNCKSDEWLYAGGPNYNTDRTYALSWGRAGNPTLDVDMRWYIQ